MKKNRLLLLAVASSAVFACSMTTPGGSNAPRGSNGPGSSTIANTDWVLGTLADTPLVSGSNVTLQFSIVHAAGFGGCNQYNASYESDGVSTLTFGPIASTRMACVGEGGVFETAYFAALARVRTYKIEGTTLTLSGEGGAALLTYGEAVPATVEGPWNVTNVNNGAEAVVSIPIGVSASMSFLPDGTMEGFGGCNNFHGQYSVDGDSIEIGPLASTMIACEGDAGTFKSQLLIALENSTTWSVSGTTLDLRDDDGAQQVEATSAIGN